MILATIAKKYDRRTNKSITILNQTRKELTKIFNQISKRSSRRKSLYIRFLIKICDDNENEKMKFVSTIPNKWTGKIKRLIEEVSKNKVKVAFELPYGEKYIGIISKSYLRN